MKNSRLFVAATALAAFVGLSQAAPYSAWTKYREVTINTTATGANVAATVTNFPVLVRLSSASEGAGASVLSEALAGGADIRFTDSTGNTALGYEIESWSATSAAIWVKVPAVLGNASTKIRLYWNRSGAPSASSGASVFGGNNFLGVWHLGNATGAAVRPNSANPGTNDAVPSGSAASTMTPKAGIIGFADSLRAQSASNGGQETDDHFNMGQIVFPDSQVSVSMWLRLPDPQAFVNWNHFFTHGNTTLDTNLWMGREGSTTNLRARSAHGGAESGNSASTTIAGALSTLETWMHVGVTKDSLGGKRWRVYKDGVMAINFYNANENHRFVSGLRRFNYIGRSLWADPNSHIKVDEMRTSSVARSPDWMKLEYATQRSDTTTAVTLGAAQTQAAPALAYTVKNATYLVGQAIATNTPISSGSPTGYSVAPALPAGLTLNTNGTITGTPTAATASASYVVSATLNAATVRDTLVIAVVAGTPPGAPLNVTGVRGSRQVTVSWSVPSSSGTTAITGYKAMAAADTTKFCTTTGALTCTVTGLTNGTSYTFIVKASSSVGTGPASAPSAAVTPASRPGRPGSFTVTQIASTNTATATWTAAADSGAAIQNYFIFTVPTGGTCAATPPALTCTVTGLAAGTTYSVRLYAFNSVGAGDTATASLTTTGIRGNDLLLRVAGMSKPFSFSLPMEMIATTEKITLSISNVQGRTVWSKSLNPVAGQNEVTWNGKASNGTAASAGTYMVRVSLVDKQGKVTNVDRKTISIRP